MITHIVCFKLKERTPENMAEAVSVLEGLAETVPHVRSLEAGSDVVGGGSSFDIALTVTFDNLEDLDAYRVHPEHQKVVEYIKEVTTERVAVDYEK